jgi:hypothetical protein
VLVDGQWDNANFWTRYAFLRRALGLAEAHETGIMGKFNHKSAAQAFETFGFAETCNFGRHVTHRRRYRTDALHLVSETSDPAGILDWTLPYDFPATTVYDGLLKRQRRGMVDLGDPLLVDYVAEALSAIHEAEDLFAAHDFDLLVTSHAIDFAYTALVWAAARHDVPALVLYGDYGSARFIRIDSLDRTFTYPGRPSRADWTALTHDQRASLTHNGMEYLEQRFRGDTGDVGAIYAFQQRTVAVDKAVMAEHYGWDSDKPILAVYASNWFDYPHFSDRMPYRDFIDWMEVTIEQAAANTDANWLFKAHPCDTWYGKIRGITLAKMLASREEPHLAMMRADWTGRDILTSVDGLVTCHGTAGIEAAALGTPVLVAYPGWYSDADFALTCSGREEYAGALARRWWDEPDITRGTEQARAFAGWYFCVPDWHGTYVFPDDANQNAIWRGLDGFLGNHAEAIGLELHLLREWAVSRDPYYHVFKMRRAKGYSSPEREKGLVEGIPETGVAA